MLLTEVKNMPPNDEKPAAYEIRAGGDGEDKKPAAYEIRAGGDVKNKKPAAYETRAGGDVKNKKPAMDDLRLRRLNELNSKLREDLERPRIKVSEASMSLIRYCFNTKDPMVTSVGGEARQTKL